MNRCSSPVFVTCLVAVALSGAACDLSVGVPDVNDVLTVVNDGGASRATIDGAPAASDGGASAAPVTDGGAVADATTSTSADAMPPALPLPSGLGWIRIPGATIKDACPYDQDPTIAAIEGCSAIVEDWCGGIADTKRNRLIVWGGGHGGYFGNELYSLDLGTQKLVRLNDASAPYPDPQVCSDVAGDGNPASRHTYDNLAYVAHADRMFARGGAPACWPGGGSNGTWTLDAATLAWQNMNPTTGPMGGTTFISPSDYDPVTHLVFLQDTQHLWSYDYDTNTYSLLRDNDSTDYHLTGRVDPERRLFLLIGNGEVHAYDLSSSSPPYGRQDWTLSGCDPIVNAIYPGLAYDPDEKKFVAWAGGDEVYLLDPSTKSCQAVTSPNGPGPQVANGTNGRFRYFPSLRVFALVNEWDQDAYLFRLRP